MAYENTCRSPGPQAPFPDLSEVRGQEAAKQALEIAAAGGHPLLLVGPSGVGKSLLARCLAGLLPALRPDESREIEPIYSAAGLAPPKERPVRSPPITATARELTGYRRPGEVHLAHTGVLLLDDLQYFKPRALAGLASALDEVSSGAARATRRGPWPANAHLIATVRSCPCGRRSPLDGDCRCTPGIVARHRQRAVGPVEDRFHLLVLVELAPASLSELGRHSGATSKEVAQRVAAARRLQYRRYQGSPYFNAAMGPQELRCFAGLGSQARSLFDAAVERLSFSPRDSENVLRVARTIADLNGQDTIGPSALAQAVQYRAFAWGV